jgi:hypothetical protein
MSKKNYPPTTLMIFREIQMDDDLAEVQPAPEPGDDPEEQPEKVSEAIANLQNEFQARLVIANLRTEAVRSGMIDLDGLKLVDLSAVRMGNDDKIIGGRKLMDDLRRTKPWLFGMTSSSSAAIAPVSQPARRKTALEMTDEEYAAARTAITKHLF